MLLWFLWFFAGRVPVIQNPKPVEPQGTVEKGKVIFATEAYRCELEAVNPRNIRALLVELGASERELGRADVGHVLDRTVIFKITLQNLSTSKLVFNPDHVILGARGSGPAASQLDMATFWPASLPDSAVEREKLASVFARTTVHLQPDATHTQYVAFRAFGGRFPKKVYLELNDLYAGVDPLTIKCAFNIKYLDI